MNFENIVFNVEKKFVTINNCQNLIVKFNVTNNEFSIKRVVRFNFVIKISAKSIVFISFKLRDKKNKLFTNRNFIFISYRINRLNKNNDVLLHIVNVHIVVVLI